MSKSPGFKVAVVGATGAVGKVMLDVLAERKFPVKSLVPLASSRSEGKKLRFKDEEVVCKKLSDSCFEGCDFVFFDASDEVSKTWVPVAAKSNAWVIDNSNAFRMSPDVPLIVPEVNGIEVRNLIRANKSKVIAGPNCTTAQMVVALHPLHEKFGLERVVVSTYQSVSGAGSAAMEELRDQTQKYLNGEPLEPRHLAHEIPFNCIPQIGGFQDNGNTSEENKMILETRKILGIPDLRMSATAVRVPAFWCHGESINVELKRSVSPKEVHDLFRNAPGLEVLDEPIRKIYPLGEKAKFTDPVFVGRIRKDDSVKYGVNFWIIADNLRKGAALNAVQIAEAVLNQMH